MSKSLITTTKDSVNPMHQIFNSKEFGNLEIVMVDNKPYFPATKCAEILGYVNPQDAIRRHCKGVRETLTPTHNQYGAKVDQQVRYIPEGDLYRLIIRSKLSTAIKFERWVFEEVLPSIRENGKYTLDEAAGIILRVGSKASHHHHDRIIDQVLAPHKVTDGLRRKIRAQEADKLNRITFGKTAKEYRNDHPDMPRNKNMRDEATVSQLWILLNLETANAALLKAGVDEEERFTTLCELAGDYFTDAFGTNVNDGPESRLEQLKRLPVMNIDEYVDWEIDTMIDGIPFKTLAYKFIDMVCSVAVHEDDLECHYPVQDGEDLHLWNFKINTPSGTILVDIDDSLKKIGNQEYITSDGYDISKGIRSLDSLRHSLRENLPAYSILAYNDELHDNTPVLAYHNNEIMNLKQLMAIINPISKKDLKQLLSSKSN